MTARVGMWRDVARQAESVRRSRRSPETERVLVRATAAGPRASAPSSLSALDNATMRTPALKPCTQAAEPRSGVRQHERQWRCDLRVVQRFARSSLPASLAFTPNTTGHAEPPNTARVAVSWKCDSRREMAAAPSRRSFVVRWKASRCFDDELGIIPSHSADAPALGVLELDQRRRDAHRRDADDDMEAPSVADDCSDLEHSHKHAPNACASKESAASLAGSIPSSEACPRVGACRSFAKRRQLRTSTRAERTTACRER